MVIIKYNYNKVQYLNFHVQYKDINVNVIIKLIKLHKDYYVYIVKNIQLYLIKNYVIN